MGSRKNQRHLVHRQNIHARQGLFKNNFAGKSRGQISSAKTLWWGWYSLFEYVQFLWVCPGEVRMVGHQVYSMRHSILWEHCVRVLCEKTWLQRICTMVSKILQWTDLLQLNAVSNTLFFFLHWPQSSCDTVRKGSCDLACNNQSRLWQFVILLRSPHSHFQPHVAFYCLKVAVCCINKLPANS